MQIGISQDAKNAMQLDQSVSLENVISVFSTVLLLPKEPKAFAVETLSEIATQTATRVTHQDCEILKFIRTHMNSKVVSNSPCL